MKPLKAIVLNDPKSQHVIFEIQQENKVVARLLKESGKKVEIDIYAPSGGKAWHFDLDEFVERLDDAKETLKDNP